MRRTLSNFGRVCTRVARAAGTFAVLSTFAVAASSSTGSAREEAPALSTETRGFYVGLGAHASSFDVDLGERTTPTVPEFEFDTASEGLDISVGYRFGPRFHLELGATGAKYESRPADTSVFFGAVRLTGVIPLVERACIQPVLLAGFGLSGLGFDGTDFEKRLYLGIRGDVGAGVRVNLSRRFVMHGRFIYSTHNLDWELLIIDDETDLRSVSGTAWSRSALAGLVWNF